METIEKYFPSLSSVQKNKLRQLSVLFTEWNQKINLISRKDIDHLYIRHILHSLAIARYIKFTPGSEILDLGTGGGFPGIPLAIIFPECQFVLVDSIHKKIRVVEALIKSLELKNCTARCMRVEESKDKFDFIVCRAVAPLSQLIAWTSKNISKKQNNNIPNGLLALKGGDIGQELEIDMTYSVIPLDKFFDDPFFETKKLVHVQY